MERDERKTNAVDDDGFGVVTDGQAARLRGGAKIWVPVGVAADGTVVGHWVES